MSDIDMFTKEDIPTLLKLKTCCEHSITRFNESLVKDDLFSGFICAYQTIIHFIDGISYKIEEEEKEEG